MAELGSILASTLNAMGTSLIDQVFDGYPFTAWLKAGDRVKPVDGGVNIQEPIGMKKNGTVGWRDYREDIPINEDDPFDSVIFPWRWLNGSVSWFDAQEKMNNGKQQIFDFVEEKTNNFIESMTEALSLGFFADGTGKQPHGIPAIVSATNNYGGIDRSDAANALWRAHILSTAEVLTIRGGTDGGIRHLYNLCSGNGGTLPPDFGITTEALFTRIESLIDPQRVYENPKLIELGFPNHIQIDNMAIVWDTNCTAGAFYALQSKFVKLRPHTANAKKFSLTKPQEMYSQGQMGKAILGEWMGNLTCTRPNRCGALTGKTAA